MPGLSHGWPTVGATGVDRAFADGYKSRLSARSPAVASKTLKTWNRRKRMHKNLGRTRKNRQARKSTLSEAELFAGFGEPGKPAPKTV
jgi:hypothetical protein